MYTATQSIFPKRFWDHINIFISPKEEGNCLGIQFISDDGDYTLAVNTGSGTPKDLLRKLYLVVTDLYMQAIEEEKK